MLNENEDEEWELSPSNSHPRAIQLLIDDFYWDCADDNSPFGNDTGADTRISFRQWREQDSESSPIVFLNQLLDEWEVGNDDWDVIDTAQIEKLLEADGFSFLTRDDAIIGLAFGQFVVEGRVDTEIKRRAMLAIRRQAMPEVIEYRGWVDAGERIERLEKMLTALREM